MNIKKYFYNLILNALVFNIVVTYLFDIIILPADFIYLTATLIIVGFSMSLAKPVLKFLTVKTSFWPLFVMTLVTVWAGLYALELLMPMFRVGQMTIGGNTIGIINISEVALNQFLTMGIVALFTGLVNSLVNLLKN